MANVKGASAAAQAAADAARRHPTSVEIGFLLAMMLMPLGRYREAETALRRILYLDPASAMAHFTLGSVLQRLGDYPSAVRAYRNARDLCDGMASDAPVPLTEGQSTHEVAQAASAQLAMLASLGVEAR